MSDLGRGPLRKIRVVAIGGGMIAQIGHLPFYATDPRCELVAICETRPSLIAALHEQYPQVRITTDLEGVIADPTVDLVIISMPRETAGPIALSSLQAGRHVV